MPPKARSRPAPDPDAALSSCAAAACRQEQQRAVTAAVALLSRFAEPKQYSARYQRTPENVALLDCQAQRCVAQAAAHLRLELRRFSRSADPAARRACLLAKALLDRPGAMDPQKYVAARQAFNNLHAGR